MRPIHCREEHVGDMFARAYSHIEDVVAYVDRIIRPHDPLEFEPQHATYWKDVEKIKILSYVACNDDPATMDLRKGTWEWFQTPRYIPLITESGMGRQFVVSSAMGYAMGLTSDLELVVRDSYSHTTGGHG